MIAPTIKSLLATEQLKRTDAAAAGYNLAFVRKRDGLMITFPAAGPAEAGQE